MPSAQCPVSPWDQARHSAAKLVRIVLSSRTIHASDIKQSVRLRLLANQSRSNQLPLSAFAKENHFFPTAVTVCHRQTVNPENMNENAVNLANYSVDFWQKLPAISQFKVDQTSNDYWSILVTASQFQMVPRPYFSKPAMTRCLGGHKVNTLGCVYFPRSNADWRNLPLPS